MQLFTVNDRRPGKFDRLIVTVNLKAKWERCATPPMTCMLMSRSEHRASRGKRHTVGNNARAWERTRTTVKIDTRGKKYLGHEACRQRAGPGHPRLLLNEKL